MKSPLLLLITALLLANEVRSAEQPNLIRTDRISFIENSEIKVGINQDLGGAITWLSVPGRDNLINNSDWGRQIQLSYYSGPKPFEPNGVKAHPAWKNWSWNPIQSGDVYLNRAKVVELINTGTKISLTSIPMQWALNNVPGDCLFKADLTLDGPMLLIHYTLINKRADKAQYNGAHQELPAVYTVSGLSRLMTYTGDKPFTGDALTHVKNDYKKPFPWTRYLATEGWVAAVGDDDWGIGVCNPKVYNYLGGLYGSSKNWDSNDGSTMYISPVSTDVLDHNIVFEFDLALRVGKLDELRSYFTGTMSKRIPPAWNFDKDRQHWVPVNCTDAGWPIQNGLRMKIAKGNKNARIQGPIHPFRAETAQKLRITGAWKGLKGTGHVTWTQLGNDKPAKPLTATFSIPEGEKLATVEVDLGSNPDYKGLITQFTVWLADNPGDGGEVVIKSIATVPVLTQRF
jgi:hypothetical protein